MNGVVEFDPNDPIDVDELKDIAKILRYWKMNPDACLKDLAREIGIDKKKFNRLAPKIDLIISLLEEGEI